MKTFNKSNLIPLFKSETGSLFPKFGSVKSELCNLLDTELDQVFRPFLTNFYYDDKKKVKRTPIPFASKMVNGNFVEGSLQKLIVILNTFGSCVITAYGEDEFARAMKLLRILKRKHEDGEAELEFGKAIWTEITIDGVLLYPFAVRVKKGILLSRRQRKGGDKN